MRCTVVEKYFIALNALMENEREAKDYGSGELIFQAEINLIDEVYRHPGINSAELSRNLKVTRGAITHVIKKLEQKNVILKYSKDENKKEKYYILTELGEKVRLNHEVYHRKANSQICSYISGLTYAEKQAILNFLDKISKMPISQFECNNNCTVI